jgi:hypothetical protein
MANYLSNKDLKAEVIRCQDANEISPILAEYFMKLASKISSKFFYQNPEDKKDVYCFMVERLLITYTGFDRKYDNAFAYFTEIAKRAAAAGFNQVKFHKNTQEGKAAKYISYDMWLDG